MRREADLRHPAPETLGTILLMVCQLRESGACTCPTLGAFAAVRAAEILLWSLHTDSVVSRFTAMLF